MLASNLKFSAGMKLDVNKKIGWLSMDSFPFNLSYGLAELSQVQDFNVDGRFWSLKHEICLMRETSIQIIILVIINSILENFLMEESSTAYLDFKFRFSATSTKKLILRVFSCCLMIGLTEIPEYLVLNSRQFWNP